MTKMSAVLLYEPPYLFIYDWDMITYIWRMTEAGASPMKPNGAEKARMPSRQVFSWEARGRRRAQVACALRILPPPSGPPPSSGGAGALLVREEHSGPNEIPVKVVRVRVFVRVMRVRVRVMWVRVMWEFG